MRLTLKSLAVTFALTIGFVDIGQAAFASKIKVPKGLRQNISFDETYERYPAPQDLFHHLQRLLPALNIELLDGDCYKLTTQNTTVLGGNLPNFGAPLEKEPGALFVELYSKCLDQALNRGLRETSQASLTNLESLIGTENLPQLVLKSRGSELYRVLWTEIDEKTRQQIQERLLLEIVGPDILLEERNLVGPESVFGPEVRTKADLLRFIEKVSFENSNHGQELYALIRGTVQLLRLGPMLVN